MSDKHTATDDLKIERSPDFRAVYSNHFRMRFGPGDGNLTFSQFRDEPGSATFKIIEELVTINLSWPQLKLVAEYLSIAVEAIEKGVGPITRPGLSKEELRKQAADIVKGFGLPKE